jgi:hypothetical protein
VTPPRGWSRLAELGPAPDGYLCGVRVGDGLCMRPAIVGLPVRGARVDPLTLEPKGLAGRQLWRCADHPPVGAEWGAGLDYTPREPCRAPRACWCGRCPREPGEQGLWQSADGAWQSTPYPGTTREG